ncbi:MAG TPA: hypothetical protein VE964_04720 [Myxococcales bacterium]|nr:hypothetical protein [Myxococcales bacterium]
MRTILWCSAAALLLGSAGVRAQVAEEPGTVGTLIPAGDRNWSATSGQTVGSGNNLLQGEIGWPGFSLTYLHGADERTDYGARVNFNYGFMNTTNNLTGVDLQVPIRYRMTDNPSGGINVALQVSPGLTLYSNHGSTLFGVGGPLGVVAGTRMSDSLNLDAGVEVPLLLSFTNPFGVVFGPLFGVGGEYFVDRNLMVTARIRMGPEISLDHTGSNTQFGLQTLIGVAYNLR